MVDALTPVAYSNTFVSTSINSATQENFSTNTPYPISPQETLPSDNTLEALEQSFFQIAGHRLEELKQTDFLELRRSFPTRGNSINYVTTLLENYTKYYGEFEKRRLGLEKDLETAVTEDVHADTTGRYTFKNFWGRKNDGSLRLLTDAGPLDRIIHRSIYDRSGQIPEFEIARNIEEGNFLYKLTAARSTGNTQTGIIFSPSPDTSRPEVRQRGYRGNDQIRFSEITPHGEEQQIIYWFPKVEGPHYLDLMYNLIACDPKHSTSTYLQSYIQRLNPDSIDDVMIMACSNVFSDAQTELIKDFITQHQKLPPVDPEIIADYEEIVVRNKVVNQLLAQTYRSAIVLLQGADGDTFTETTNQIFEQIEDAQFDFRLYIRDHGGLDTFRPEVSQKIGYSWTEFQDMNIHQRQDHINQSGFVGNGCGFRGQSMKLENGSFIWGPMSVYANIIGIRSSFPKDFGEPHHASCKGCNNYTIVGDCNFCIDCHNQF